MRRLGSLAVVAMFAAIVVPVQSQIQPSRVVDILVVYPPSVVSVLATLESTTIGAKAVAAIDAANAALERSLAVTRVRLVGVVEVAEGNSGQFQAGLSPYQTIDALRVTHGADLVVFAPVSAGVANMPTPGHPFFRMQYRASVGLLNRSTFVHEMGHLLGLRHQFYETPSDMPAGVFAYEEPVAGFVPAYAGGAHVAGLGTMSVPVRTVMADGCTGCEEQEYFSNPRLTVNGVAMGHVATADAVRAIDENAPFLAAYSDGCTYDVTPTLASDAQLQVPMSGAVYTYTVTTASTCLTGVRVQDVAWIATAGPALHAAGSGSATLTVAANDTGATRTAYAFIGDRRVLLTQQSSCRPEHITFLESAVSVAAAPADGRSTVPVKVGVRSTVSTCYPTVTSDAAWLSNQSVNEGVGNGVALLSLAAQTNRTAAARTATVTVSGRTVQVTQAAGACPLSLPVQMVLSNSGALATRQETLTGDTSCAWTASTSTPWLTLGGGSQTASGSGGGTLTATASTNDTGAMRTGAVTINGVSVPVFQLTGDATACSWSASRSPSGTVSGAAGTIAVSLTTPAGCPWAARSDVSWMSVSGSSTGIGSGTITFAVEANPARQREDTVWVGAASLTVTQSAGVSPCQMGVSSTVSSFMSSGGSGTLTVTAPAACNWVLSFSSGSDARGTPDWFSASRPLTGAGNVEVPFTIAANTGRGRGITIGVGELGFSATGTVTFTQPGVLGDTCGPGALRTLTLGPGVHALRARSLAGPGCRLDGRVDSMTGWGFSAPTFTTAYGDLDSMIVVVPEHAGGRERTADIQFGGTAAVRLVQQPRRACDFSLASSTLVLDSTSLASGTVAVTTLYDCSWQPTVPSWLTVERSGGSGWEGSGTLVVRAASANSTGVVRTASLTVGNKTLTVTQEATRGPLTIAPGSLRFRAVRGPGGAIVSSTPAQTVTMTFSGAPSSWAATTTAPWISVSPSTGTASTQMTVTVDATALTADTSAVVTVATPDAPVTSQTIAVTFEMTSTPSVPVGQVDTPTQDAAGVVGAIGVTGWVIDDIGVAGVKIYRNCLAFDDQASCQTVLGHNVVEVGDAAFLAGARTDVEGAFSAFPQNNRAGWGYLMLTSMLPHVPREQAYGGQGALTIYAVATDVEGNRKLLGRSADPASPHFATPTQITMANDSIAKPFGSIDTPGQGETVSGMLNNFGWALTADSNAIGGDPDDILIPVSGLTMTVFIDSLPVTQVAYNQCRGNVGNPVPTAVFCNDDVSNIFGNASPQPVLTNRTANATFFRNLDAGRAPIGVYTFNTATLSNGLHTIAWSVSDTAGRIEGIGSRFFNVLNSGADQAVRPAEVRSGPLMRDGGGPRTAGVFGRTGFDLSTGWVPMRTDQTNRYRVRLPEQGRLELWFGDAVEAGYLVAQDGTMRELPIGTSLSGAHFGWMPPVGYVGAYDLVFLRGGERIDVRVTVWPVTAAAEGESEVRMHLDPVHVEGPPRSPSATLGSGDRSVRIEGWVFDPQAALGPGIGAVHVWARSLVTPPGGVAPGAVFLGEATLTVDRPDVARAFDAAPVNAGYQLTTSLDPGTYEITAYAWNVRTGRWEDARSLTAIVR